MALKTFIGRLSDRNVTQGIAGGFGTGNTARNLVNATNTKTKPADLVSDGVNALAKRLQNQRNKYVQTSDGVMLKKVANAMNNR